MGRGERWMPVVGGIALGMRGAPLFVGFVCEICSGWKVWLFGNVDADESLVLFIGVDDGWMIGFEDLLLACAVNRHGSESRDSIAVELQRRASRHHLRSFYNPGNCKQNHRDLRLRFNGVDSGDGKAMVDELKRLRVAELRRDVSIEFLQLKVKRLEEERERNFKPKEEEEMNQLNEPERNSMHEVAGKSISGEDSVDGDDRSFNELNSRSNRSAENQVQIG
ncbi:hypothetical protein Acr_26g0014820 [Actinidia rufa]|uniref:Uncharacterized protein n=1 Tax=Actinidia rufa TaxID=165716 RepID=A0A7J0H531_9ERIC|nr:hypothetical protein Acr_26g0014820 [Actinidia rufa]